MTVNWRNLHRACKLLLDYSYIFVALFGFVPYFQLVESYIPIFLDPWSTWHSGIDWCIQKNLHSYLYQLFQVGNIPFRMLKQYISWGALCYLAFCILWTSHNHSFFWLTCRIKFWEENVLISCLLNSSLIDELRRWLKGCWSWARNLSQQGGIHGNPASGNLQALSYWQSQWNTYLTNTYHKIRVGAVGAVGVRIWKSLQTSNLIGCPAYFKM